MTSHLRTYRAAVRLYPKEFRREHGDDIVALFAELMADRGPRRAWSRTILDLIITLPTYRLETIMSQSRSSTVINLTVLALLASGIVALFDISPVAAVVLLGAAGVVAITQRTNLARSLRPATGSQRRKRLTWAAISAAVFAAAVVGYLIEIGDDSISGAALIAYNLIGTTSMVTAAVLLVAGLRSPRTIEGAPLAH